MVLSVVLFPPVGSNEGNDLPLVNIHRDTFEGVNMSIIGVDIFNFENCHGSYPSRLVVYQVAEKHPSAVFSSSLVVAAYFKYASLLGFRKPCIWVFLSNLRKHFFPKLLVTYKSVRATAPAERFRSSSPSQVGFDDLRVFFESPLAFPQRFFLHSPTRSRSRIFPSPPSSGVQSGEW